MIKNSKESIFKLPELNSKEVKNMKKKAEVESLKYVDSYRSLSQMLRLLHII